MNRNLSGYKVGSRLVKLVDENGQIIGNEDVFIAHQYPVKLHQAVSVWLVRKINGGTGMELLLQQRSAQKPIGAEWWGNGICGNVKPDETNLECAQRRLVEELGMQQATLPELEPIYSFHYQAYGNPQYGENEVDQVFVGKMSGAKSGFDSILPVPAEVNRVKWVPVKEFLKWANELNYISPRETLGLSGDLLEVQTQPVSFTWRGEDFLIAPWTILMAREQKLRKMLV
jgi:isopentenyl-diphosphate delta-isomerase type 1